MYSRAKSIHIFNILGTLFDAFLCKQCKNIKVIYVCLTPKYLNKNEKSYQTTEMVAPTPDKGVSKHGEREKYLDN